MIAAFVGLTVAIMIKGIWCPFAVMFAIAGFSCLFGLSTYGVGEEDPADDANAGHATWSPVTR